MGVSLASGQAVNHMVAAMLLGGSLGLLEALDHRAALDALARPEFQFWRATPHFADVLGRCALTGPAVAPPVCVLSSPVTKSVYGAFLDRFGVPLRQTYSSSETGLIAVDAGPAALVRPETVGRPLPRVEVVVGEHPGSPEPPGAPGRIWVRSPWQMAGYGFPPALERPDAVDGWWPTRDLGALDADGYLTLAGRMDDAIRTRENRLVNLSQVATALREIPGVTDAVVVPLDSAAGVTFGAVVQCGPELTLAESGAAWRTRSRPGRGLGASGSFPRCRGSRTAAPIAAAASRCSGHVAVVTRSRRLLEAMRALVTRVAGPSRAPADSGPATPLSEGGFWLDSVELLEVVVACESEFDITFDATRDFDERRLRDPGRSPRWSTGSAAAARVEP